MSEEGRPRPETEPRFSSLQPSTCLRSVMARAKADPKFGKIFRFDTPVLMWDQHFTPETWDRLKARHVPYGWLGLSRTGMDPTGMGWQQMGQGGCWEGVGQLEGPWGPAEGTEDMGQAEKPCRGARNLDLFPLCLPGRSGWLCKCHLLHLVTFSLNKSSSVCMIINWGRRSSDNPLHCCGWRLFPFLPQTHSLLSLAAASFNPWAGKCWGQRGGVNQWHLQGDIVKRGHGQHRQQHPQGWGWRCPDASPCLARPQVAAVSSRLRKVGGCEG